MRARLLPFCLLLFAAPVWAQQSRPAASAPAAPLPIPNLATQIHARDMIRNLYKSDYAKKLPADRQALAKLLLAQAKETADDPTARYVAFTEALDLSAGCGDAPTVMAIIAELARLYTVDALDLQRQNLLKAHSAAGTPQESEAVMTFALATAVNAAAIDAFDAVRELTDLAESAANKTRQVRVVASIQVQVAQLRELIAEFTQVKSAYARLDKNPDDPAAHLIIGRFYALHKNQWSLGLPHLAQSNDATLRSLAQQELSLPNTDAAQIELGDHWWDFAEASAGLARQNASAHARQWYAAAQTHIKGITLTRIQSRLENDLPAATRPGEKPLPAASGNTAAHGIDLLALMDPAKDTVQGRWSRTPAGELACEADAYAVAQIPFVPPDEYDLTVNFTRTNGPGHIALLLAARGHAFDFSLDIKGEARFERVDTKIAKDNPTAVPVVIANNHPYQLTIEIRKDAIRALLDGKLLTEYKTDFKDLSRYNLWKINDTALCGLGSNNAPVIFHSVQLIEITGHGKPLRP